MQIPRLLAKWHGTVSEMVLRKSAELQIAVEQTSILRYHVMCKVKMCTGSSLQVVAHALALYQLAASCTYGKCVYRMYTRSDADWARSK